LLFSSFKFYEIGRKSDDDVGSNLMIHIV